MPEYVIVPFESFGPVRFGMTEHDIRGLFGNPPFEKFGGIEWMYQDIGFSISFDATRRCNHVETWAPCIPILDGTALVGGYDDVVARLVASGHVSRRGEDTEVGSTYFDDIGVTVYQHDADEGSQKIDSISAWQRGCWE